MSGDPTIRYWSDFSRVYYAPRTVQKLPDTGDWEDLDGNWQVGQETFVRYNEASMLS
jgi:hypothetical protein